MLGRVRPGVDRNSVQADLDRVFDQLRRERPELFSDARERAVLMTFEEINLANVVRPLWALLAGVTVLLFIACTNVGNLLPLTPGIAVSFPSRGRAAHEQVAGAARVSTGVMAFAAGLLMAAAALSVWIPARRAMTVDPAAALRMD